MADLSPGQQTLTIQQAIDLGLEHQKAGRLPEAESIYQQILQADPNQPIALHLLGVIAHQVGKSDIAVDLITKALSIKPDYAEAHSNLGLAYRALGRLDEAVSSFQKALNFKPNFVEVHLNLGLTFLDLGRLSDSIKHCREVLKLDPKNTGGHVTLSNSLSRLVPEWHTPMMNDLWRNNAFQDAVQSAITADTHVLEIGTGSGLLSMMAGRCGAKTVTTCEMVPLIASTAKKIIADNKMENIVKVIAKKSTTLTVPEDLPRKADLLVSEILSSEFLAEEVLASIEDAKRRLLKPEGKIIPSSGNIIISLFGGNRIGEYVSVEDVCGFDLSSFNEITSKRRNLRANEYDVELLSDEVDAFCFNFQNVDYFKPEHKTLRVPIRKAGRCHGIIQWIRLQMDDSTSFENHPSVKNSASGWTHTLYIFDEPIDVTPSQVALVLAGHCRTVPWFSLESVEASA